VDRAPEEALAAGLSPLSFPEGSGRIASLLGAGADEDDEDGDGCPYAPMKSPALKGLEGNGESLGSPAENSSAFGPEREGEKFSDGLMLGNKAVFGGWSGVTLFGTVGQL
jgi:hypothetical protein